MANNDYITTDCKLTVSKNTAKLDEEIFLYKNDRNIKLLIEIVDNKYRYKSDDLSNLLVKYKASYAQVKWYKNAEVKKEFPIQATDDGKVVFVIEGELINEDTELGDYDLQLRLLNESQESIRSLPIIKGAVHILKPLFEEGDIATVNSAIADVSMLSLGGDAIDTYNSDGTYNQTNWGNGDVISSAKLNKLEKVAKDNVDKVNKMPAKSIVEGGKIYLTKEDGTKLDSGTELPVGGSTIEVVNNLESDSTTAALSAAQGKALNTQYKDIANETSYSIQRVKDNSQQEIIKSIDKCNKSNSIIKLKNGTYNIDNLKLTGLNNIIFEGSNKTILKNANTNLAIVEVSESDNITFRNITFDGGIETLNPTQFGNNGICYNTNSVNLIVENCIFKNINDTCIIDRTQSLLSTEYSKSTNIKIGNSIIINNKFYNCKHSYLTKGGGCINGVYLNNFHNNCISGIKIDGETFEQEYPTKAGNFVISNNVFFDCSVLEAYSKNELAMVQTEEHVKNIVVCNNIFSKLSNLCAVKITSGQTYKDVENIKINNNIIENLVGNYGIVIRNETSTTKEATMKNIIVTSNLFNNLEKYYIFCMFQGKGEMDNLDISNNRFLVTNPIKNFVLNVDIAGSEFTIKNFILKNNIFNCSSGTISDDENTGIIRFANKDNQIDQNDFIIDSNKFSNNDTTINKSIYIDNVSLVFRNNIFNGIIINAYDCNAYINSNDFTSSLFFLYKKTKETKSKFILNRFEKGLLTNAYGVRIDDSGNHIGKDNIFIGGFATPFYVVTGTYNDVSNAIYYNNKYYKIIRNADETLSTELLNI